MSTMDKNCLRYLHVLSNDAKLTLYSIVKIPFLNNRWGGGGEVKILYHNKEMSTMD